MWERDTGFREQVGGVRCVEAGIVECSKGWRCMVEGVTEG